MVLLVRRAVKDLSFAVLDFFCFWVFVCWRLLDDLKLCLIE